MILAIGANDLWSAAGKAFLARLGPAERVPIQALNAPLLDRLRPHVIVSPWMCTAFDCLELAMRLDSLGFRGRYRAVVDALGRPGIVRQEVRGACGEVDFDLIVLSALDTACPPDLMG